MTIDEWLTGPNWGHEEYRHADGLATLIWTSDISGAHRLARQVDTGLAWIYCGNFWTAASPYEGQRASGIGVDMGLEVIESYIKRKSVIVDLTARHHPWAEMS